MKHLGDEDIARMIEGTISKKEREHFLKHLSECNSCFNVYTETLKFVEKEKKSKHVLKSPVLDKTAVRRYWLDIRTLFKNRRPVLVPAFAALIIILLMVPFLLNYLHHRGIENNKMVYIEKIVEEIENRGVHAFSGSKGEIYAALRAGIFVEDLSLVVNAGRKEELKTKITKTLSRQLEVFASKKSPLLLELANIEKKNVETVVKRISELFQSHSYSELFRFGRFVEQSILSTYENKTPKQEDIEKYQRILQKYEDTLPLGVFRELKKLETASRIEENRNICIAIKELFIE
ncbi:MAG: hypothetical protein GTO45_00400 [Candidatus Aminicenantes bacterium]|nr:hypothetical protein [Candidatus Aminicenantes bacterium]NIM77225.1 hypothetical protein [Candidatus Aminicenantes bacterium]NIN16521.1 hypothetical protein [Candidatus Aminicenantes bacterium]NIN40381.1 hypothetical protein [Candidatus Aminicenantes bacterium]NIN83201.1 hypothetical protein [Candidatus Aminicenantes bacterium]